MGNNTSHSKNKFKKTKSQASCMACVPNNEMTSSLDPNELNIFKAFGQPKGKISPKSIAYLSKDEINFLKASGGRNISAIRYYLKKGVQVKKNLIINFKKRFRLILLMKIEQVLCMLHLDLQVFKL